MRGVVAVVLLLANGAGAIAVVEDAGPSTVKLFLFDEDGDATTGPAYLSAVTPPWTGEAWGGAATVGNCLTVPASVGPHWGVPLSVDAWPLPSQANYGHLHSRESSYDVPLSGSLHLDWTYRLTGGAPSALVYFEAKVVAMEWDSQQRTWLEHAVLAQGSSAPFTPMAEGQVSFPLSLVKPTWPAGTLLELHVDFFASEELCQLLGNPPNPVPARAWASEDVRPALTISTTEPIRVERVHGQFAAPTLQVFAAFGQGQFDSPGGHAVLVDGQPTAGRWSFDAPVHEDFHPMFNGNRTWHFEGPPAGDVRFVFRTADGVETTIDWPALEPVADCAHDGQALACAEVSRLESETTPLPMVAVLVAVFAAAWGRRTGR